MRKTQKTTVVVGGTIAAVLVGGVAFAYWSTSGSGTGSASTTDGTTGYTLEFSDNAPSGLAPDIDPTNLNVTVTNTGDQAAYVAGLTAKVTTPALSGCDAAWFNINGTPADSAVPLVWDGIDLATNASQTSVVGANTIQFVDKPLVDQNACKDTEVTIVYASN
jgi:hypothetical protein